jgi:hypothetical protein
MLHAAEREAKKQLRNALSLLGIGKRGRVVEEYFGRPILSATEGNGLISGLLASQRPLLVARIGETELACLNDYQRQRGRSRITFRASVSKAMCNNAGFFPASDQLLERFCCEFLECLRSADVIGVWFNKNEDRVCRDFAPHAALVRLRSLEPYYHPMPWSLNLKDKKVLVVHPFEQTITSQVTLHRERLFADPGVLPPFRLETVKAVQSIAGNRTGFQDWFQAYRHMCDQICAKDFDVAIIGAGAYGLHLASFVKTLGKQAIHLGGATQILFGIKGRRWDDHEVIAKLYNPFWVRPSPEEVPEESGKVEKGCYW